MSDRTIEIQALGKKNASSEGQEVIFLGAYHPKTNSRLGMTDVEPGKGWELIHEVNCGPGLGVSAQAFRGSDGTTRIEASPDYRLLFIAHPWSGLVAIRRGEEVLEYDLYSPETRVLSIDPDADEITQITTKESEFIGFATAATSGPLMRPGESTAKDGELIIRPLGTSSPAAMERTVRLVEVKPFGFGVSLDLTEISRRLGWDVEEDVSIDGRDWTLVKGASGALRLNCRPEGQISFLANEYSGHVEVTYGSDSVVIDLFAAPPRMMEFRARDIAGFLEAAKSGASAQTKIAAPAKPASTKAPAKSKDAAPAQPARVKQSRRRAHYEKLTEHFDPHKPIAIYVPRWRGVALSTETLFEQSVPIPAGLEEHPDEITKADIQEYAEILLETGARHFIVSGGDTFNLKIVEAMHSREPGIRIDMLWHSNYLQMGELHDWNLLRHWLQALRDGKVTRIGVVKEGLENWFKEIGISSVFIPNVVPFDARTAKPTGVTDAVGIWLSGSSHYRKTPLAAISALSMMPGVSLMASGLDDSARAVIRSMNTPFRHLWDKPLPREVLYKQMRQTGLTLYVTLSECSPMLPLESFSQGVPCLVGPASHLFRHDKVLREALLVERPLSPAAIAEKAKDAMTRQKDLLKQYARYHKEVTKQAKAGVAALLA